YHAVNSQNSPSNNTTVTLAFPTGNGLTVAMQDVQPKEPITDYKWIIEQNLTFQIDPACQQNGSGGTKPATCPAGVPPTLGTNFHASYMPVVATGCTGALSCGRGQTVYDGNPSSPTYQQHIQAACDGYGICTPGATQLPTTLPSAVHLATTDANGKPIYYYISILPGDAATPFDYANTRDPSGAGNCLPAPGQTEPTGLTSPSGSICGHTMGGAPIAPICA